jgi:hypothetical protein
MKPTITSVSQYLDDLTGERKVPMVKLRNVINENISQGFNEGISYGMIGWGVPHSLYPKGYHYDPKLPLPFLSIASQKNFIALYHMGIYADKELHDWFTAEFPKHVATKLDMGKSCIRFKKPDAIPYDLIGQLVSKMTVQQWIDVYENTFNK